MATTPKRDRRKDFRLTFQYEGAPLYKDAFEGSDLALVKAREIAARGAVVTVARHSDGAVIFDSETRFEAHWDDCRKPADQIRNDWSERDDEDE